MFMLLMVKFVQVLTVISNLCINNEFDIIPAIVESEEYKRTTCSINIINQGYKCCSSCLDINFTDEFGNWGIFTTITNTTTTLVEFLFQQKENQVLLSNLDIMYIGSINSFTNKCLYAPQKKSNKPITVKAGEDSDYSM